MIAGVERGHVLLTVYERGIAQHRFPHFAINVSKRCCCSCNRSIFEYFRVTNFVAIT